MAHRGFWRELKRRHVYRVAAAYALVGWLLIQVATWVFPVFHLPGWIDQALVLLILLGFPIAIEHRARAPELKAMAGRSVLAFEGRQTDLHQIDRYPTSTRGRHAY